MFRYRLLLKLRAGLAKQKGIGTRLVKGVSTSHRLPRAAMTTSTSTHPHAFTLLLAQYIAGDVSEEQLSSLCEVVEGAGASASERLAFASYYLDAKRDDATAIPKADEWMEIADAARA